VILGLWVNDLHKKHYEQTIMVVHNRDQLEIFQNSLIERMPKAAFWALDLSIKYSRRFPSDLKTNQEVL